MLRKFQIYNNRPTLQNIGLVKVGNKDAVKY